MEAPMKRQGDTILDQPAAKKSDNVSTDLRSKIGAKLSTLLNRLSSANAARSKRQLYEDLFRESTHSEIIIDPTIVVKIEESDSDDCSEDATKIPAENFLTSAKSRLTELLHKRQNSEKENSPSSSGSSVASSVKSKTLQSISCNALNRTKSSNNESSDSSNSEIFISQKQLKNVYVLVEDIVKSGSINSIHSLFNEQTKNKIYSSSIQNFSSENMKSIMNTQKHKNAKDNHITDKEVVSNQKSHQSVDQHLDVINRPSSSQSHSNSLFSNLKKSASQNISQIDVPKSVIAKRNDHPLTNDCELPNNILNLGDILIDRDNAKLQSYAEDSEYVDDPLIVDETVDTEENELESNCINADFIQPDENPDTDVVLLCEKRPTYEVITLEEDDVVEDVHECPKCGKTFRAKSLLNFHLRMHGSNLNESLFIEEK